MKVDELSTLSDEALVHKEMELERALTAHLFRHRVGRLENTSVLAKTRKDIARAKTILRRREIEAGLNKGALHARHQSSFVPAASSTSAAAGEGFLSKMVDEGGAAE